MSDLTDTFVINLQDGESRFVQGYALVYKVENDIFDFFIHKPHSDSGVRFMNEWQISHKQSGHRVTTFIQRDDEYGELLVRAWEALEQLVKKYGVERVYRILREATPQ